MINQYYLISFKLEDGTNHTAAVMGSLQAWYKSKRALGVDMVLNKAQRINEKLFFKAAALTRGTV